MFVGPELDERLAHDRRHRILAAEHDAESPDFLEHSDLGSPRHALAAPLGGEPHAEKTCGGGLLMEAVGKVEDFLVEVTQELRIDL